MHHDEANEVCRHGSPVLLPKTGTVQAEFVSGLPEAQPVKRFRPKKYWVPSVVVTFQYSPLSSPLLAPVSSSTREPSSPLSFHVPVASSRISSPACPAMDSVALYEPQHSSPVLVVLLALPPMSSAHALYPRVMEPGQNAKPSPAQDGWLLLAAEWPSTDCAEYASVTSGFGPSSDGGTRIG